MRYNKISFIFVISMVDLVGRNRIKYNFNRPIRLATLDPQNPLKPHSDRKSVPLKP